MEPKPQGNGIRKRTRLRRFLRIPHKLPVWITGTVRDIDALKILFRCYLTNLICMFLIFPTSVRQLLGSACYFPALAAFILPPNFPLQLYVLALFTMVIGSLTGWAYSCAAMAASLVVRSQARLDAAYLASGGVNINDDASTARFLRMIFSGQFLDPRSTAMYGVFFCVGCFFFAYMRTIAPTLALFSVFGCAFVDVVCSYGPFFPTVDYDISKIFFIAIGIFMAVSLSAIILIFPHSLAHEHLHLISTCASTIETIFKVQGKVAAPVQLTDEDLEDAEASLAESRQAVLSITSQLQSQEGLLEIEASYGVFNASDIHAIGVPLRALAIQLIKLSSDYIIKWRRDTLLLLQPTRSQASFPASGPSSASASVVTLTEDQPSSKLKNIDEAAELDTVSHLSKLPALHDDLLIPPLANLGTACLDAMAFLAFAVSDLNSAALFTRRTPSKDLRIMTLKHRSSVAEGLLAPCARIPDSVAASLRTYAMDGQGRLPPALRPLVFSIAHANNVRRAAEALVVLLDRFGELLAERKRRKLWTPVKISKVYHLFMGDGDEHLKAEVNWQEKEEKPEKPDEKVPLKSRVWHALKRFGVWSMTTKGIYCYKFTFVSFAFWLPTILPQTADFMYREKGLWAMGAAQSGILINGLGRGKVYLHKLIAAVLGLSFGLAIWYTGAGLGDGTALRVGASWAVFSLPLIFLRLFSPYVGLALSFGMSTVLIIGSSWEATRSKGAEPEIGIEIAWRRWLLTAIGIAGAAIVMLLPPWPRHQADEDTGNSSINGLRDMLNKKRSPKDDVEAPPQGDAGVSASMRASLMIGGRRMSLMDLVNERRGSIRPTSSPSEALTTLHEISIAVSALDEVWRPRLKQKKRILQPGLVNEIKTTFSILVSLFTPSSPGLVCQLFWPSLIPASRGSPLTVEAITNFTDGLMEVFGSLARLDDVRASAERLGSERPMAGSSAWRGDFQLTTLATGHISTEHETNCGETGDVGL
ncbi:hypothetical protein T439DRAFT_380062 [Meredithblackwellia eburnea MCA 4105]